MARGFAMPSPRKITEPGVRRRAEFYYQHLDALRPVREQVRELLAEGNKHPAWKRLCQIPAIGPTRAAVLLNILQTEFCPLFRH
jgi:hypothetical protein